MLGVLFIWGFTAKDLIPLVPLVDNEQDFPHQVLVAATFEKNCDDLIAALVQRGVNNDRKLRPLQWYGFDCLEIEIIQPTLTRSGDTNFSFRSTIILGPKYEKASTPVFNKGLNLVRIRSNFGEQIKKEIVVD